MTQAQKRPWLVLAGLALGVTVTNGFARFSYGLILPAMQSDLGWNYAQAGWLNTANALGYIAGAILTMLMIGRYSATSLFSFGLVTTNLALLATGLSAELWWQTLWRILVGFFGALSFGSGLVAVRDVINSIYWCAQLVYYTLNYCKLLYDINVRQRG